MRVAMGTCIAVQVQAPTPALAGAGLEAAFAAVADVARRMHPRDAGSEIARLNEAAPGTVVPLSAATLTVLRFAQHLNKLSAGFFDPCVPAKAGRLTDLELTEAAGPAAICHAPLELDLGGIAKGFAVDCAIEALREAGCAAGLVNAGGDVRVIGPTRELILLRRPEGALQPHELCEAALAVSDRDARQVPCGHRGYYVRVAAAPAKWRYAAIRARTAMAADALTKCALLCPAPLTHSLLKALEGQRVA